MSDDENAIRRLVETWMTATRVGDTQAVLGLMTDDVVFLVPGRPPFGKAAYAEAAAALAGTKIDGSSTIKELTINGDWAFMRTALALTITPSGAAPVIRRTGNTLTILRKESDGRWRIARDANLLAAPT